MGIFFTKLLQHVFLILLGISSFYFTATAGDCAPADGQTKVAKVEKAAGEEFELYSPDNTLKITVSLQDGNLFYKVDKNSSGIIDVSKLGLKTGKVSLDSGFVYLSESRTVIDETYSLPTGKRSSYHNYCNELTLNFSHSLLNMSVIFRAYDDGCAFRYYLPDGSGSFVITGESTQFKYINFENSLGMKWSSDYSEYFELRNWNQIKPVGRFATPFLTKHGDNYCLLTEAANYGTYAASALIADQSVPMFTLEPAGNINVTFPLFTPWRVIMIGALPTIVESSMVEHLNPPSEFTDWSWIVPGRASWDWGGEHTNTSDLNTNLTYIDFAGRMGWEYSLIDAGWTDSQVSTIMSRANKNGVKIFLWFNTSQFPSDKAGIKTILQKYKNQGVVGVKVDFWENDNQATMKKYDTFMQAAMEVQMMVNFHGCTKPSGIRRRWPHLMTTEAVLGGEFYIQNSTMPTVYDNINITFTRNVIGSMDYTPVEFATPTRGEGGITRTNTSWAHQVAQSVAYESALQVFLDSPENYDNNIALEFLKRVPTRWDDIKCLEAMPNQYSTIARKNGEDWYLGALCNNARTLDISLDFLDDGVYFAHIYKDGNCKTVIDFELRQVQKTDRLTIPMLQGGGVAIQFTKNPSLPVPQNIIVEAEAGGNIYGGNAKKIADRNASGGYRIGSLGNDLKSYLTINVEAPEDGTYAMSVFYCTTQRRKVYVSVNGMKREPYYFSNKEGAADCSRLNMRTINVFLHKGNNTVKFINENDYIPDFDRFSFIKTNLATVTPQTEPDYVLCPYDITDDGGVLTAQYDNETLKNLTDNNVETKFVVNNPQSGFWIQYEAKVPVVLTGYALCSADDKPEYDPMQWRLDGSNDGETWKTIQTKGQSFDRLETRIYPVWNVMNIIPYKYYRLTITSLNQGPDFQLAEWQLYGYKTEMPEGNLVTDASRLTAQYQGGVENLMDNAYNTQYVAGADSASGWIMYDLGASKTIVSYELQNISDANRYNDPCTWELQGSNNRSTWTALDHREEINFMVPLHQMFLKTQTQLPYRWIRLNISDTKSGKPVKLSGWQLYLTDEVTSIQSVMKQDANAIYHAWGDRGKLHLKGTEKTAYTIYGIEGAPIAKGIFDTELTINNIPEGIYLVILGKGKNCIIKKVVI